MRTLLCLFLAVGTLHSAPVDEAARLLQNKQFREAAAVLTDADTQSGGWARYLRATARRGAGDHAGAIADCDLVPEADLWHRKALFLKAECLAELKRHEEAQEIYQAEAARLFATVRKEKLAAALVELAEELRKPALPGQIVSNDAFNKAHTLYTKALELETGPAVRENILFQLADIARVLFKQPQSIAAYEAYLREFDPDWPQTLRARETGTRRWKVRQMLIETLLTTAYEGGARKQAEDLLAIWKKSPPPAGTQPDAGEIEWLICRSHQNKPVNVLASQGTDFYRTDHPALVTALRAFLKKNGSHPRAAQAAEMLTRSLTAEKKTEEAIAACKALYERADWPAPAVDDADKRTPAERIAAWRQEAFFNIGELHFGARDYAQAITQWRDYIAKHPEGSLWQQAQARILDAEFQLCLDAVAAKDRAESARRFDAFIAAHPLDERCAQLLFINGQWHHTIAMEAVKAKTDAKAAFESAIAEWAKLITKHPQSDEASLALYRTGVILAEHLDRHEEALAAFQRLKWGSWQTLAAERAAMMPQRSLALRSPRVFRRTETAQVIVNTRNIEKLKISRYTLNLEDYFRARHRLDGIGSLDIDLIQPDKTWEVSIAGYARLKPFEQAIDVPFEGAQPGVCLVRVEGEDWQASTIVLRSDVDVITQAAWREGLVFVMDRVKNTPVSGAEVLFSDGKEIIGQGVTGADGVFRLRSEKVRAAADLCAFVRCAAGMAVTRLNLRGMTQEITGGSTDRESVALSARGFIYTDRPAYSAGEVLHFRGLFREVKDGSFFVPEGVEHEIVIKDDENRVLRRLRSKLGAHGSYTHSVDLPPNMPLGRYDIVSTPMGSEQRFEASFQVSDFKLEEISAVIETKPDAVFRGDVIEAVLRVKYSWGAPLAEEPVRVDLPDGRLLEGKTDKDGLFTFKYDTAGAEPGSYIPLRAELPARRREITHAVPVLRTALSLEWDRVPSPALSGEAALIRIKALDHRGKAAAAEVKLTLSKVPAQPANAILEGVPGLRHVPAASAPVKVEEFTVKTDAQTGLATVSPMLAEVGEWRVRAEAKDERGNALEIQHGLFSVGAEHEVKLRLFQEDDEVSEGRVAKVDAHTFLPATHALVTFAGEDIVEHRLIELKAGHNDVEALVRAAHWPHFLVQVAYFHERTVFTASKSFRVTRPLKIEIETPAQPPEPGAEVEVTLTVKGADGKPAANAELSLALASSALFAQFGDGVESIEGHFHSGLRRATSFRSATTAGFHHDAESKVLKLDEAGAALASATAMPSHRDLELRLQQREIETWRDSQEDGRQHQRLRLVQQDFVAPGEFDPPQLQQGALVINGGGIQAYTGATFTLNATSTAVGLRAGNMPIEQALIHLGSNAAFAHDAQWHCPLVTDAEGKARVKVIAPVAVAGEWRLKAVGCTLSTEVGAVVKQMVTQNDVAISMSAPQILRAGDSFTPVIKLLGEGLELNGERSIVSSVWPADLPEPTKFAMKLKAGWNTIQGLEAIQMPQRPDLYGLRMDVWSLVPRRTGGGQTAHLSMSQVGERQEATTASMLPIPGELVLDTPPRAKVAVRMFGGHAELLSGLIPLLQPSPPPITQTSASRLMTHLAGWPVIKDAERKPRTHAGIKMTISELQITQSRDGGWSWQSVNWLPDSLVTSLGLWSMVEAKAQGFEVEEDAVKKATECLKGMLAVIPPEEPDKAAVILHALACVNEADFSVANRLYRDRAKLNDPSLAWLAAAFQRMNRVTEAKELLKALEAKAEWKGSTTTSRLSSDDDTCAAVLYAAARVEAGSALAKKAAERLLGRLGVELGAHSPLQGVWAAALAEHFIGMKLHEAPAAEELTLKYDGQSRGVVNGFETVLAEPKEGGNGLVKLGFEYKGANARPIVITSVISEVAVDEKAAAQRDLPVVLHRKWMHEGLRHKDVPLKNKGESPVKVAAHGQRIRVHLVLQKPAKEQRGYVIVDEPLPGGAMLVPGSVYSGAERVEVLPGLLRLWFIPGSFQEDKGIGYELMALHAGTYAIPHTRVRDACRPQRFNAGPAGRLTILEPGKASPDVYVMDSQVRLELAGLLFAEDANEEARKHLEVLRADVESMKEHEREIARMLLWIHTARQPMDARQVVELFEALSERHADIVIPFDKILQVAAAYRQIGEFERAWLVYRATMESGFVRDAGVSAAMEAAGDFPGGAAHLTELWMEHPDAADGLLAFFSLGQRFQEMAGHPASVPLRPGAAKWSEKQLLERSRDLLRQFATLHAKDELADDAVFSLANVFFALKDYAAVVETAGSAARTFAKSPFVNQFHYMTALGRFWQYQFPEALNAAAPVAGGNSEDAPNARYITAQIHHAQGNAAEAVRWYEKVEEEFDDAAESIRVLEEKGVKLPHATRVKPGEPAKVELEHRNVKEAALTIYRVDLMKLHERQKDLSAVGAVNLSGITPQAELKVPLGDGADYAWKKRVLDLPLKDEGAYLLICRGDSQMSSGLVLVTTLELETHQDAQNGSLRAQVRDTARGAYLADAEMAVFDSSSTTAPQKGRSDPRGAFTASGIAGHATLVVKHGESRYAIHRSATPLMPFRARREDVQSPETSGANAPIQNPAARQEAKPMSKDDYLKNVQGRFLDLNSSNSLEWQGKLQKGGKGVKAEKAFKK
jgi:hypothetical protein